MFLVQSLPAEHTPVSSEAAGQKCSLLIIDSRSLGWLQFNLEGDVRCVRGRASGQHPIQPGHAHECWRRRSCQTAGLLTAIPWIFLLLLQLFRIINASFSTMSTCCPRMTGTCTPARSNPDTCPSPSTVSSTGFPMMISLVGSVPSLWTSFR